MSLWDLQINLPRWTAAAACSDSPTSWFFVPDVVKEELKDGEAMPQERYLKGREVCRKCTVRGECLDYALKTKTRVGIWGGLTASQRQRMTRRGHA